MRYEILSEPTELSVGMATIRAHCRKVDSIFDDEIPMLTLYCRAIENFILRRRNLALKPATFKVYVEKEDEGKPFVILPVCPVIDITDEQGNEIDNVYTSGQPSKLYGSFVEGQSFVVTAGFEGDIPQDLQAAVLLGTSERYERREINEAIKLEEVPKAFADLISHWGFTT